LIQREKLGFWGEEVAGPTQSGSKITDFMENQPYDTTEADPKFVFHLKASSYNSFLHYHTFKS